MGKGRLEAFSDGVLAIIITIMVLEMKAPHGGDMAVLLPVQPVFFSYILSFVYVGICWNSHHHILQAARKVSAGVMWANLHLLFWLSLLPFATAWMGENHFATLPTALYGIILAMMGLAFLILERAIIRSDGSTSLLAVALNRTDHKGLLAVALYAAAIPLAFVNPTLSQVIYLVVALLYLVPDRRIEGVLPHE
ncbi:MAG: TMEM175 family protein [Anaerolineae bacterium]